MRFLTRLALLAGCALGSTQLTHAQDMYIRSCSLGCSAGAPGDQIVCSVVDVHFNEVFEIEFSLPIDLSSVSTNSLQIVDVNNGTTPVMNVRVSPSDPNVLLFESEVSASPMGGLDYTMRSNRSYQILIAGVNQGDSAPYIRSVSGLPTLGRFLCTVFTSQGNLPLARPECATSPNSVGSGALMSATGTTSVVLNDLEIQVTDLPSASFGILAVGLGQEFRPLGAGILCIESSLTRQGIALSSAAGVVDWPIDVNGFGSGLVIAPGSTWRFQHVYRDVIGGVTTFTTSDALRATFF